MTTTTTRTTKNAPHVSNKQSNLSTSKQNIFHQTALSVNSLQIEIRFNRFIINFCLFGLHWGGIRLVSFESLTNMKCSQLTSTKKSQQNVFGHIDCGCDSRCK